MCEAGALASTNRLDLLELVAGDGAIVSSAAVAGAIRIQGGLARPANRTGNRAPPSSNAKNCRTGGPGAGGGTHLAYGDMKLYVAGGRALDREFIASLVPPRGDAGAALSQPGAGVFAGRADRRPRPGGVGHGASFADGSLVTINAGATPPTGGGFEIRLRDFGFMAGADPTLVMRSTQSAITITRQSVNDKFYIRMYDGSTPPNYSEFSTALFINLPL